MNSKLKDMFEYQRFSPNDHLSKVIAETESRYSDELSLDELDNVAGGNSRTQFKPSTCVEGNGGVLNLSGGANGMKTGSTNMSTMTCGNCGAPIKTTDKVCKACGTKLMNLC